MKHYLKSFIIKVSDLLKEGGKSDTLYFEHKISPEISGLNKEGVSGKIILRSLHQDSLFITLEDLSCKLEDVCDRC